MKNYIQRGENLTIPAPAAISSGDVVIVGEIIGVAAAGAAIGESVDVVTEGVFELSKAAEAFAVGAAIYWDSASKLATSTATDNTKIGVAIEAAAAGDATACVKLQ